MKNGSFSYLTLVLVGCFFTQLSAQNWVVRNNMTAAQYQTEFNNLTANGFRPVQICGYDDRFAAIFEKQTNPPAWSARHNLTATQYQTEFNTLTSQGFRPVRMSGYTTGGQSPLAAIFEKRPGGVAWFAFHNLTAAQYQTDFTKWTGQGYKLTVIYSFTVSGVDYYTAIFDKIVSPAAWVAKHNMTGANFQTEDNSLRTQGYKIAMIAVNASGKYAAVWEKNIQPLREMRHSLSQVDFQKAFDVLYYQNMRPIWINGTKIGSSEKISGVWEQFESFADVVNSKNGIILSHPQRRLDPDPKQLQWCVTFIVGACVQWSHRGFGSQF